jgi:hypothetical protein
MEQAVHFIEAKQQAVGRPLDTSNRLRFSSGRRARSIHKTILNKTNVLMPMNPASACVAAASHGPRMRHTASAGPMTQTDSSAFPVESVLSC